MKLKRLISCGLVGILTGVGILMNAKVSSAEDKTYDYTFTKKVFSKNESKKLGDIEWNLSGDGGYWGFAKDTGPQKGQQFGSGSSPYKNLKLNTTVEINNVKEITVYACTASKVTATMQFSIGELKSENYTLSTTNKAYTYTLDSQTSGIVEININQTTSKSLYIKEIKMTYSDSVMYNVSFFDGTKEYTEYAKKVEENGKLIRPTDPEKEGYVFAGWYVDPELSKEYNFDASITADLKLYAKFEEAAAVETQTVTFMKDSKTTYDTSVVKKGNTVGVPAEPINDGYSFAGWYTDVKCTTAYDFNLPVNTDITLYAKWLAKYTVSFDTDCGSTVETQTVVTGDKATIPTSTPTKKGYNFVGWYTDNTYTTEFDFENTIITDNTTIYAKFEDASIIRLNGYTFNKISTLEELTTGYYVIGGYNEKANTNYYMGEISGGIFSADVTYKNYYGIKAENGKILIQDLNDNYINLVAEKKVELSKPKKTYFEPKMVDDEFQFVINDSFSFQFNPGSPRFTAYKLTSKLGNLVLYKAKGVTPINVTYKDLKGNELAKDQLLPKQKPSNLKGPALPGHKFVGWCKEGTDTIYDFNAEIQEDVVLVAKYEALTPAELFEQLEIKNQLAYHWQTEDGTTYTIDNVSLRFGVNLTEEMKSLEGVKFGAILAKKVDVANINLSEYARECTSAAEVVAGDPNLKYLEFTNIAAEGGMTSLRLDNLDSALAEEFVVVIYMEYNGKLYVTEQKIASVKVIASEYLKSDLEILKNEQIKGSLNQLSK